MRSVQWKQLDPVRALVPKTDLEGVWRVEAAHGAAVPHRPAVVLVAHKLCVSTFARGTTAAMTCGVQETHVDPRYKHSVRSLNQHSTLKCCKLAVFVCLIHTCSEPLPVSW